MTKKVLISLDELNTLFSIDDAKELLVERPEYFMAIMQGRALGWFDAQPASPQWVSVADGLPSAHELVFIHVKSMDKIFEAVFHDDRMSFDIDYHAYNPTGISYGLSINDVTHWMPIPPLPEVEE